MFITVTESKSGHRPWAEVQTYEVTLQEKAHTVRAVTQTRMWGHQHHQEEGPFPFPHSWYHPILAALFPLCPGNHQQRLYHYCFQGCRRHLLPDVIMGRWKKTWEMGSS